MKGLVLVMILALGQMALEHRANQRLSPERVEQIDRFYAWLERSRTIRERRERWLRGERWH